MKLRLGLAALVAGGTTGATSPQQPVPRPVAPPPPPIIFLPPPPAPPRVATANADALGQLVSLIGRPATAADLATAKAAFAAGDRDTYTYTFLDVRKNVLSPRVLAEFDKQFIDGLDSRGIGTTLFHFGDSPLGDMFADNSTSATIPVPQVILLNQAAEKAAGARFRIIVFPTSIVNSGAWRFYQIRFSMIDTRTGARVWSYLYEGRHMVFWKESENAESRAKKITDAALADLTKTGLIY